MCWFLGPLLLSASEGSVHMLSPKWHQLPPFLAFPRWTFFRCLQGPSAAFWTNPAPFLLSRKLPNRIRNSQWSFTCYCTMNGTFRFIIWRKCPTEDHKQYWWRKCFCKSAEGAHPLGNPKSNLLAPPPQIFIVMWSGGIKYLCLFTGVIKLYSIMSQALPNDCWKLSNNTKTHKNTG